MVEPVGEEWLYPLMTWLSPAYPVGAFSYSHGLEWLVETGAVTDAAGLAGYVEAVLARGGGWTDLVLFAAAWRAGAAGDDATLDAVAELAGALRGTAETAQESGQQGAAFALATAAAWPGTPLDALAARVLPEMVRPERRPSPSPLCGSPPSPRERGEGRDEGRPGGLAYAVAVAAACAGLVPLEPALLAYAQAVAANLISAGVRLIPLGQTSGQRTLAGLAPVLRGIVARALATPLDELGSAAPLIDLASMHHETQYTRLFRS